ncbi:hypothetical protein F2P79_024999, partial [Pimephales promelas]
REGIDRETEEEEKFWRAAAEVRVRKWRVRPLQPRLRGIAPLDKTHAFGVRDSGSNPL